MYFPCSAIFGYLKESGTLPAGGCVSGAVGVPCVEYMMLLKGVKNMKQMKRGLLFAVTVMIALSIVGCGQKQTEYPSKDIELVIPWSAGGGTDVATRLYAS